MNKRLRGQSLALLFFLCLILSSVFFAPMSCKADSVSLCSPDQPDCDWQKVIQKDDLRFNETYLKGYIYDTGKILYSPSRWDNKDWYTAALLVSVTAGFYTYDQDLAQWLQKKRNGTTDAIAKVFNPFGNGLYTLPSLGLVYLYGEVQASEKARRIALLGMESIVISGAFTTLIKFAGHRHRPDTTDRYNRWAGPGFSTDNLSFPSEHASAAFSLAKVIASESDSPYVAPVAYGVASLVALSRMNDNKHWCSDVFLGAALGYFTASAVISYHKKKDAPLLLLPDVGDDHYGIHMLHRF